MGGCFSTQPPREHTNQNTQRKVTSYKPYNTNYNQQQVPQQEPVDDITLAGELIEKCGFSVASDINKEILLLALQQINPRGLTSLRDAIAISAAKMLSLKIVLNKLGITGHQFIHIVLTDGDDTSSKNTLRDIQNMYYELGREIGSDYFKTFFIGVGLDSRAEQQLQSVADLAGDSAELFSCDDVQLSDVFDRIKLSLGMERRVALATNGQYYVAATQDQYYVTAHTQKFLVLFDLDVSGSMRVGRHISRWSRLQTELKGFFQALNKYDIIGCVLFNDKCVCLTGTALNSATDRYA